MTFLMNELVWVIGGVGPYLSIMIYLTRTSFIDRPTSLKFPLDLPSRWEAL